VTVLRSLAAGAVIVGVVSVAAALTLLPAMLSLIGDRVNALPLPVVGKNLGRSDAGESRIWTAVTATVMRRPAVSLALAGGVMVLAAVPVLGLHIGQSGVATLPGNLPSKQGYLAVQRYFPGQSQDPVEIVAVGGGGAARADLAKLDAVLAGDPRFGPGVVQASPDGTILTLTVPIRGDAVSSPDVAAVLSLRQQLIPPAFAGFARGQLLQFQEMGFGVAAALILDATLIRLVILPGTLSLLGPRSWYLPRWLDWLPHLQAEPPQAPSCEDPVTVARRL
jgi:RND superfamily putative drug exporter